MGATDDLEKPEVSTSVQTDDTAKFVNAILMMPKKKNKFCCKKINRFLQHKTNKFQPGSFKWEKRVFLYVKHPTFADPQY